MIYACVMVYSLPCHKDTLLLVMSRLRLQYEKAVSEHLLYVKWKAKRMSVPMLVFFKYPLSSYSRVAKTALQCPPAESKTQGKTHSVSRMQYLEFPLVLRRMAGYLYIP